MRYVESCSRLRPGREPAHRSQADEPDRPDRSSIIRGRGRTLGLLCRRCERPSHPTPSHPIRSDPIRSVSPGHGTSYTGSQSLSWGRKAQVAEYVLPLPRSPDSVGRARSAIREALVGLPGDVAEVSALLANELVANAIAHGEGSISMATEIRSDCVRVVVTDEGTVLPVLQETNPTAESGRGLSIVSALATRWGVDLGGPGKSVWFELVIHS